MTLASVLTNASGTFATDVGNSSRRGSGLMVLEVPQSMDYGRLTEDEATVWLLWGN